MGKRTTKTQPRNKPPRTGDRVPLGLRTTPQLQQALAEAAKRNGRSLSQETEFRLERSIERSDLFAEVLELRYGRQVAGLVAVVGLAMRHTLELVAINAAQAKIATPGNSPIPSDLDWLVDPFAYSEVVKAATLSLQLLGPAAGKEPSPAEKAAQRKDAWASVPSRQAALAIAAELAGLVRVNDRDPLEQLRPLLAGMKMPKSAKLPDSDR